MVEMFNLARLCSPSRGPVSGNDPPEPGETRQQQPGQVVEVEQEVETQQSQHPARHRLVQLSLVARALVPDPVHSAGEAAGAQGGPLAEVEGTGRACGQQGGGGAQQVGEEVARAARCQRTSQLSHLSNQGNFHNCRQRNRVKPNQPKNFDE